MRRADRLFRIVEYLRRKSVVTAAELAEWLEVSQRTIYRDMDDLSAGGLPLRAEAGMGYALQKGYDLPPLMFRTDELEALEMASRMLMAWSDPELKEAADSALAKIRAVLPHTLRRRSELPFYAPDYFIDEKIWAPLPVLRRALREQRKIRMAYTKENGEESFRVLRPLGLNFWGQVWTLCAWCEWRGDFRHFRLDRMQHWELLDDVFAAEPGKTIDDLLAQIEAEYGKQNKCAG